MQSQTKLVPNLVQGVSQQSAEQRRDTQCERQFDCFNSPADGAAARPPAEFVKLWAGRDWTEAFLQETHREDENYLLVVVDGEAFAIDLEDGTDCTVTEIGGAYSSGYLTPDTVEASEAIRAQTVEDTTFILNRTIRPAMSATESPALPNEALVFIKSGAFDANYAITLTGLGAALGSNGAGSYKTPRSDQPTEEDLTKPVSIATELRADLNAVNGYTVDRHGAVLHIYRADGEDFTLVCEDDSGGDFMYAIKGLVSAYSKLPAIAPTGFTVKVRGDSRTRVDDYYVEFVGEPSTGYWEETVGPEVQTTLDPDTMPHLLVNTGYRTFEYSQTDYSTRIVGDEESAKDPSFVGRLPRDIFWDNSRLAFLHEAGCVWSKTDFPYTYFPDTVQTVLATAPVDSRLIASQANRGGSFLPDYAVPIDEGLYLWAQRAQWRVATAGDNAFKQESAEIKISMAYEYAARCRPLALGKSLYFATDADPYASVRILQFNQGRLQGETDVTTHVPEYVPSGVFDIVGSDTLRCAFILSKGYTEGLFLYNFLSEGADLVQSAWNTWRIPGGPILWAGIKNKTLRVLQQRTEGLAFLHFNLSLRRVDDVSGATYLTRLDMRVDEDGVSGLAFDAGTNTTSFTLPYTPAGDMAIRVVTRADKTGGFTRGREFPVTDVTGAVVTVAGDLRDYEFYCGHRISAERWESEYYIRSDEGPLPVDRLTVDTFTVSFSKTGYTRIEVESTNGNSREYVWEGRTLGTPSATTETPVLRSGKLQAAIRQLSKEVSTLKLINDSYLPSAWQSAMWEYTAVRRNQ